MRRAKNDSRVVWLLGAALCISVSRPCYSADNKPSMEIRVSPVNSKYVEIATQNSEGFDALVLKLLPENLAGLALQVKPYLFVASNRSSRTILAYCVRVVLTFDDGSKQRVNLPVKDVRAALTKWSWATDRDEQLVKGRQRVFTLGMVFNHEPGNTSPSVVLSFKNKIEEMFPPSRVRYMEVETDAVIFGDGTLVGPDTTGLAGKVSALVSAERNLLIQILGQVDSGRPLEDVIREMDGSPEDAQLDRQSIVKTKAIEDVEEIRRRLGDRQFMTTIRAIAVSKPFVVRRVP